MIKYRNPSHPQTKILTYLKPNLNPTRTDIKKLNRTGKHVLKLPQLSGNKDGKLDHNNKRNKDDSKPCEDNKTIKKEEII
jgi:hypothetical protein